MSILMALDKLRKSINVDYPVDSKIDSSNRLRSCLLNVVGFVEQNITTTYYPISKLFKAADCKSPKDIIAITGYLTSDSIKFMTITFCYYPFDTDEVIEISAESYRESKFEGEIAVDKISGEEIEDFDSSRLGYFCYLSDFDGK